jgi:hypothetical protein
MHTGELPLVVWKLNAPTFTILRKNYLVLELREVFTCNYSIGTLALVLNFACLIPVCSPLNTGK